MRQGNSKVNRATNREIQHIIQQDQMTYATTSLFTVLLCIVPSQIISLTQLKIVSVYKLCCSNALAAGYLTDWKPGFLFFF